MDVIHLAIEKGGPRIAVAVQQIAAIREKAPGGDLGIMTTAGIEYTSKEPYDQFLLRLQPKQARFTKGGGGE